MIIIEHSKRLKRHRFIENQDAAFWAKDTSGIQLYEGLITKIGQDSIRLNGVPYAYGDITSWQKDYDQNRLPRTFRFFIKTAGRLFFAISAFNGIVNNDAPLIHPSAFIALGLGEGLNLAIKHIFKTNYPLEQGKWVLKVVDFSPAETTEP
ncbi:MAG: hypothetical protein ACPF8V_03765 [Luteibaculum sp.]